MKRRIRELHANTHGAIGVLVLLTIWCFVALIAMLWNTTEYAVRRQHMQNAVDSVAYTSSMWTARTLNQLTAQNMLISQDASADIIFRAANDTKASIDKELKGELRLVQQIEDGQKKLASRLDGLVTAINTQYSLLNDSLSLVKSDLASGTIKFPDKQSAIVYANKVRQAGYAAAWVQNTYVAELQQLVDQAKNAKLTLQMLEEARATIGDPNAQAAAASESEYDVWARFSNQIGSAPENTSELMAQSENEIASDEAELMSRYQSTTVSQQADAVANFYSLGATPRMDVPTPAMQAADPSIARIDHVDSIRLNHPELNRNPNVVLDPINPNSQDPNDPDNYDADIVYPGFNVPKPPPNFVNPNIPHGWGHCWAFPIERYLSSRVSEDMAGLQTGFMAPIDLLRQQLALRWATELGIQLNVPQLPASIPDVALDPITQQPTTVPILPDLTATDESGQKTSVDFNYRRASGAYLGAVRQLENALRQYQGMFNRFTVPYAVPAWQGNVSNEHFIVSSEVGRAKGFAVLHSYQFVPIPEWARAGMQASLIESMSWQIYRRNPDLWPVGPETAFMWLRPHVEEIVAEMMSRPWPYEKTPPFVPVPPALGMPKNDRQNYFSIFTIAVSNDSNGPKLMFPPFFGKSQPVVAFAQAEAFNWMEYNDLYGGYYTEKFDEVSLNTFGSLLACPRAWRLSTVGGWNWQPRLSVSDDLSRVTAGSEVQQDLTKGGVTNTDPTTISTLTLH